MFSPDTKNTLVSADIFFPPLKTEGALPLINRQINQHLIPRQSHQTLVDYIYTNKGKSNDDLLRQWMREISQEGNNFANNGHESLG